MAEEDIPKTAFRCPGHVGLFEWIVMTFGLKNAGATYQRAMNFIFHEFIGKLVEIYIDDMVVKSGDFTRHLTDLRKVLECTRKHGLKMNPNKCAFGVSAGQFLGFMVVGYFKRKQKNPQVHGYRCSFDPGVFQSIDFPQGT